MRRTRKAINNLSLQKNIIRKAPIQSGIKHLCTSRAQNDTLEATLSHSAQAHSAYAHHVRRMMRLKQHWVTACRTTVLMRILCAEWCAWSNIESQRASAALQSPHREVQAQRREILMRSVLNLCDSLLSLSFNRFKCQLLCLWITLHSALYNSIVI